MLFPGQGSQTPDMRGSVARERSPLGWSTNGADVEDDRPQDTARLGRSQHVTSRPCAPTPSDRGVDASQKIADECTSRRVWTLQRSGSQ